jgi:ligand-binding sensor domain-containing protein/two-component sensor histidine kinase
VKRVITSKQAILHLRKTPRISQRSNIGDRPMPAPTISVSGDKVRSLSFLAVILSLFVIVQSNQALAIPQVKISSSSLSNKIAQPTITAVFKDHNGFLWIGTQHGLYQFDGVKLSKYGSDVSSSKWIPVSYIQRISEDSNGRLIVATFGGGILAWDSPKQSFQILQDSNNADLAYITELLVSKTDIALAGTKEGLFRYDLSRSTNTPQLPVKLGEIDKKREISALISGVNGEVYVASGLELYKVSENFDSVKKIEWIENISHKHDRVTALALDESGRIFIGTDRGLLISRDLAKHENQAIIELGTDTPISITALLFHKNLLWIGTNNGLSYTDRGLSFLKTYLSENSGLSNSQITTLSGENDLLWVGTYQGINTITFVPFEIFNKENSGVFNDVLAFEEDINNNLWVGTFNGLYLFDRDAESHTRFQNLAVSDEILDHRIMTISSKGSELWLGFQKNGVQVVNTESLAVRTPSIDNLKGLEVTKILHTGDERTWIATFNQGLYRLDNEKTISYLLNGALPESSITILFETNNGAIIASSERKIYQYHESADQFRAIDLTFDEAKESPLILSISQNGNGDLWIGTKDQGLFVWKKADQIRGNLGLEKPESNTNFSNSTIYGIQFDEDGNAWCSTQSGIFNLDSDGNFISQYNSSDGLQGSDFNFGASFQGFSGRMYFGGSNGYNRFTPKNIEAKQTPPRLLITRVVLSGYGNIESFDAIDLKKIQLTHKDYFVQFDFSVLDFLDPEKNQYRYMLEGFDPDWIENGTRNSATYTSLPPGQYTLRVQGANSAGVWNRDGISLDIEVLPPPWLTWWAFLIYALLFVFLGWLGKRAYDSYVVERRARELALVMVEAEERADDEMQEQLEIHDDLVKSVYRHSVSTLNLVSEVIGIKGSWLGEDDAREVTGGTIKRVAALTLLEDCLYYQNELLLADLNKYTDTIISRLLEDSPILEETITTINEVSSRALSFEQASPLAIAMYELLENAIQHAFEGAGHHYLHIILSRQHSGQSGSDYRLSVEDDGLGIPANIDPLASQTPGLAIVASMVKRLSGEISYTLDKGTLVTISFHCPQS